jgi:hypothetical protein
VPLDALLANADELARRWAIALILGRPLGRIGELPLEDLAREGPPLCAQALRALQSDAELARLTEGSAEAGAEHARHHLPAAHRLSALVGLEDAGSAVAALEALRGVLWEALLEEIGPSIPDRFDARQVGDLADRLAHVCASMLLASMAEEASGAREGTGPAVTGPERAAHRPDLASPVRRGAVLIDELGDVSASGPAGLRAAVPVSPRVRPAEARPLPWDTPVAVQRPVMRGGSSTAPTEGGPSRDTASGDSA